MTNRLADSLSPYLQQHKDNPVDWWEWSPEAFAEARRRDVPILLSVGYAACHWCHVMAHESFEDTGVAAVVNANYVAIKVDREERPDVDAAYMSATTAMTGHGGWPMTCLLTPDGKPFFAGTYFPKRQFLDLLTNAMHVWQTRRGDVLASGARIAEVLGAATDAASGDALAADDLAAAVVALARGYDNVHGGFGGAPKFPPSMVLEFLLAHHGRTGSDQALALARHTAEAMARSGMYDQLAGGFARYAVDAAWVVPHFEKMLYDNALLAGVYADLYAVTGDPLARRIACESADFIVRDLGTAQGAFASALDADTDGVEGLTYVWTPAQLVEVLGDEAGARAAELLVVTPEGTFEHGASTLQLPQDPDDDIWWAQARTRLLDVRGRRSQPARDDKVVTSWNGLAIAGLVKVATRCGRPDFLDAAVRAGTFLRDHHLIDGRLRRTSRDGRVGSAAGVLDDHGNLATAFLTLAQATGDAAWLTAAGDLLAVALTHFRDGAGGWQDTADDADALFIRPRSSGDNAEPSGLSAMAGALLTYAALTGSSEHREAAERALAAGGPLARQAPRFAGRLLTVAEAAAAGPLQVALVGEPDDPAVATLKAVIDASTTPGLVLAFGRPDAQGHPLLADRPLVNGGAAAYVCRGFVCDLPVTTPEALTAALA